MNREPDRPLPPALRRRLDEEPPADRAALARTWALLDAHAATAEPPPLREAWAALSERHGWPSEDAVSPNGAPSSNGAAARRASDRRAIPASPSRRIRRWPWAALALVVTLAVGAGVWRWPVHLTAAPGTQTTATLPDGSTAELNSGTTLTYRRGFAALPLVPAGRRVVRLDGEAFFSVQAGARPFVVETFNARIEVLGTQFGVRAYPEAFATAATRVTLAEGRVRLTTRATAGEGVTLAEGGTAAHVAADAPAPTSPAPVATDRVLAWRQRGFAASAEPLAAVLGALERRYDVSITLRDAAAAQDAMTLYYPRPVRVETILSDICRAKGLQYRPASRGYEIFRPARSGQTPAP